MSQFQLSNFRLILTQVALELAETFAIPVSPQFAQFSFQGVLFLLEIHSLFIVIGVFRSADVLQNHRFEFRLSTTREDTKQRVVVFRRDRVELVVMAPSARDG